MWWLLRVVELSHLLDLISHANTFKCSYIFLKEKTCTRLFELSIDFAYILHVSFQIHFGGVQRKKLSSSDLIVYKLYPDAVWIYE